MASKCKWMDGWEEALFAFLASHPCPIRGLSSWPPTPHAPLPIHQMGERWHERGASRAFRLTPSASAEPWEPPLELLLALALSHPVAPFLCPTHAGAFARVPTATTLSLCTPAVARRPGDPGGMAGAPLTWGSWAGNSKRYTHGSVGFSVCVCAVHKTHAPTTHAALEPGISSRGGCLPPPRPGLATWGPGTYRWPSSPSPGHHPPRSRAPSPPTSYPPTPSLTIQQHKQGFVSLPTPFVTRRQSQWVDEP